MPPLSFNGSMMQSVFSDPVALVGTFENLLLNHWRPLWHHSRGGITTLAVLRALWLFLVHFHQLSDTGYNLSKTDTRGGMFTPGNTLMWTKLMQRDIRGLAHKLVALQSWGIGNWCHGNRTWYHAKRPMSMSLRWKYGAWGLWKEAMGFVYLLVVHCTQSRRRKSKYGLRSSQFCPSGTVTALCYSHHCPSSVRYWT